MTVVNFAVAMLIPRIVARVGQAALIVTGIALTLIGMIWLSRITPDANYLLGVALPMVVVGAGQGLVFAPLTSAGIAGVSTRDAGAASGLVNTFHQIGMSLGLGILMAVSANAGTATADAPAATQMTEQVSAALTAGSVLLGLCLVVSLVLIVPAERARTRQSHPSPALAGEGESS